MAYVYAGVTELRKAAIRRREDADKLREARRWRGAMYMLGYALECSIKARLMERHRLLTLMDLESHLASRRGKDVSLRTHSLEELLELTGTSHRLSRETRRAYNLCRTWRVDWRYSPDNGKEVDCGDFFESCDRFLSFVRTSV